MTIAELNSRFGAPGRIVFRAGFGGYPEVVLACQYGAAEVALLGANVLSYRPTGIGPVVFRPAKRDYNRGDKFHGGIPVCWPQFGNRFSRDLPQHGFASKMVFEVRASEYSEEKTELTLGITSDEETRKMWPHDFDLTLKVVLSMKLNLSLVTKNTGKEPFDFSAGFHPYFLLRDRNRVTVRGLKGTTFFNGLEGTPGNEQTDDLVMDHETDHIFDLPAALRHEFAILDAGLGRAIGLATAGNNKMVVWNPGPNATPCDQEPDDWKKFVCVEPVTDWPGGRTLGAGETQELVLAMQGVMKNEPRGEKNEEA